jgi:hypothetical protein
MDLSLRRAALALGLLIAAPANAFAAGAVDASAETLFTEGRRLLAARRFAEACPKFAESQRLDPAIGTLLNLGDCYDKLGKTASAWATFREAAGSAHRAGDAKRERVAQERAAALEGKLSTLTITAPDAAAGTTILRDGSGVGPAQWGVAAPVDPGPHDVEASAPGKRRWTAHVEVDAAHPAATITVPPLVDLPPSPRPSAPAAVDGAPRIGGQKIAAAVTGGAGLAAIALGTVFGVMARGKRDDSAAHCRGNLCDALGVELRDDALTAADASTASFVIGIAALTGGAVLWFTAPKSAPPTVGRASVSAAVGPGLAAVTVRGAF